MSNETKFTDAPWMVTLTADGDYSINTHTHTAVSVAESRVSDRDVVVKDDDGYPQFGEGVDYIEHHRYNAHLIAAAPELYESLKIAVEVLEKTANDTLIGRNAAEDARTVLARARGEHQ